MPPERRRVTFVLTSCGRFDFLSRTLDSFLMHNLYPIEEYILVEDSEDERGLKACLSDFPGLRFKVLFNSKRLGQLPSIDKAYAEVRTPYIFHCEDDWIFQGNAFIEASMELLE